MLFHGQIAVCFFFSPVPPLSDILADSPSQPPHDSQLHAGLGVTFCCGLFTALGPLRTPAKIAYNKVLRIPKVTDTSTV